METKDRFKKQKNSLGKTTWSFQAFRTTRRGFKTKREAQLAYLELEKDYKRRKKYSVVTKNFRLLPKCGLIIIRGFVNKNKAHMTRGKH